MTKHLTFTLLAAALLAGCGNLSATGATSLLGLAADGTALAGAKADGRKGPGGPGGMMGKRGGGPLGMFAELNLTDEQKTQIAAIEAKHRPARPADAAGEQPVDAVATLLKAETLDVEALKAALANRKAPERPAGADHGALLTEIRAVLTDAQREAIVAKLSAQPDAAKAAGDRPAPPTAADHVKQLAAQAKLTDAQQAVFLAFATKMEANRPAKPSDADHAARQAAMIAFWQTGDASGLTPPTPPTPPAFPVDEFVALAQALSVEQRAQLLARSPGMGPMGGHAGPGGPGMGGMGHHEGPGGPGMGGPGLDGMGRHEGPDGPGMGFGGGPRDGQGELGHGMRPVGADAAAE